ncbi:MAG TPA: DinB family protein [Anaerolineales bacterium]
MDEIALYRQDLLTALDDVKRELSKAVMAVPSNAWCVTLGPEARTPHYTLVHMRDLEKRVYIPNLNLIIAEDNPLLPFFDDETWTLRHYHPGEASGKILDEFTRLQEQEVTWLRDLPTASWSRTARHPWWGVRTFQWWVELQLDQSRRHVERLSSFPAV